MILSVFKCSYFSYPLQAHTQSNEVNIKYTCSLVFSRLSATLALDTQQVSATTNGQKHKIFIVEHSRKWYQIPAYWNVKYKMMLVYIPPTIAFVISQGYLYFICFCDRNFLMTFFESLSSTNNLKS